MSAPYSWFSLFSSLFLPCRSTRVINGFFLCRDWGNGILLDIFRDGVLLLSAFWKRLSKGLFGRIVLDEIEASSISSSHLLPHRVSFSKKTSDLEPQDGGHPSFRGQIHHSRNVEKPSPERQTWSPERLKTAPGTATFVCGMATNSSRNCSCGPCNEKTQKLRPQNGKSKAQNKGV